MKQSLAGDLIEGFEVQKEKVYLFLYSWLGPWLSESPGTRMNYSSGIRVN